MRRARITRILYHPNHNDVGKSGWVALDKPFRPYGWDEDAYPFYLDNEDADHLLKTKEFELLSQYDR